jgi:hypothetical protein
VFCPTSDLTINADNISYEKEKNLVIAEGSVEVVCRDAVVYGNHIIYNSSAETVHAEEGFNLVQSGISIEGDRLDYAIKEKNGSAFDVSFVYKGLELSGRQIKFSADELAKNIWLDDPPDNLQWSYVQFLDLFVNPAIGVIYILGLIEFIIEFSYEKTKS